MNPLNLHQFFEANRLIVTHYKERVEQNRFSHPALSLRARQELAKWEQEAGGLLERALGFALSHPEKKKDE